jgi:transcriptional regulator with XRE-family HTH domain
MNAIQSNRIRLLMTEMNLTLTELHQRLRNTAGNEKLARPTISKIVNDTYPAEPGVSIVTGLSQVFSTSTDYILGIVDERWPGELAQQFARVPNDDLTDWLLQQNVELAQIMQDIEHLPEDERQEILRHFADEIKLIRRLVAARREGLEDG